MTFGKVKLASLGSVHEMFKDEKTENCLPDSGDETRKEKKQWALLHDLQRDQPLLTSR